MPYRPRVAPTSADPLSEGLRGLRAGFQESQDRRRQRELDEERRRQTSRAEEFQELDLHERGWRRGEAPTMQEEMRPPEIFEGQAGQPRGEDPGDLFGELRQMGRPQPEPDPFGGAAPGSFVSGLGFAPAKRPQADTRVGLQRAPMAERPDPRFEAGPEGFHRDLEGTPEARAQSHARSQQEMERDETLEALQGLRHLDPGQRRAIAAGVSPSVALPPREQEARPAFPTTGADDWDTNLARLREREQAFREVRGESSSQDAIAGRRVIERVSQTLRSIIGGLLPGAELTDSHRDTAAQAEGYDNWEHYRRAMRVHNLRVLPDGEVQVADPVDARMDELIAEGLTADEIERILREEGFDGDT